MQVQRINNNQPSFQAGITLHIAKGMMDAEEITKSIALANKIGTSADIIDVTIGSIRKPNPQNPNTWYPIQILTCIGRKLDKIDLGQTKVLSPGEELQRPSERLSKLLEKLAEKNSPEHKKALPFDDFWE